MSFLYLHMHMHLPLTLAVFLASYTKIPISPRPHLLQAHLREHKESEDYESDASVYAHEFNEWYVFNSDDDADIFEDILPSVCHINSYGTKPQILSLSS